MPGSDIHATVTTELAIERGRVAIACPFVRVDAAPDLGSHGSRYTFAIVEPIRQSAASWDIARDLLALLEGEIDRRASQTATAALLDSIDVANQWLYEYNLDLPPSEQVEFGLTCLLTRDDNLYIAQLAPSQVLVGQEGQLYAFPGLDPSSREEATLPLGAAPDTSPELFYTTVAPGDLIVLVSTSLVDAIARSDQEPFVEYEPDAVRLYLSDLATEFEVDDAYAAVIAVGDAVVSRGRRNHGFLNRLGDICSQLLPEETLDRFRRGSGGDRSRHLHLDEQIELDLPEQAGHTQAEPVEAPPTKDLLHHSQSFDSWEYDAFGQNTGVVEDMGAPSSGSQAGDADAGLSDGDTGSYQASKDSDGVSRPSLATSVQKGMGKLTGLLAGAILALSATVVGVWQFTVHRDRPIEGPRDDGTLGLPRLNRYDDRPRLPDFSGVRARLPRMPFGRTTGLIAIILVIAVGTALGISIHNSRIAAHNAKVQSLLDAAIAQQQKADSAADPAVAQAYILAAQARLRDAAKAGLSSQKVDAEQAAIAASRDKALHIVRLTGINVLGGVPAAAKDVQPRVFFGGDGQLYVFTNALYQVGSNGTTLVQLLAPGVSVGGQPVGTLLGAAWGNNGPIAFDGNAAYLYDPSTASWSRQPLGTPGTPYSNIAASSGFLGNLYLLSPGSGQILKFTASQFNQQPEDWTGGQASDQLRQGTDMIVDGRIYVLLKSGKILDFYMSALEKTITPQVTPAITDAVGFWESANSQNLYLADSTRILKIDRSGKLLEQYMPAAGGPQFANIRDMAISGDGSLAYVLTNDELMEIHLPATK